MHLTLVGLSHKTAPVEIREKLTFPANTQEHALTRLTECDAVSEAVIVSTCNRTEIYAVTQQQRSRDFVGMNVLVKEAFDAIEKLSEQKGGVTGAPSVAITSPYEGASIDAATGELKDEITVPVRYTVLHPSPF